MAQPDRPPPPPRLLAGLWGPILMGFAIVAVAVAMVLQRYLFDGDALSDAGRTLFGR